MNVYKWLVFAWAGHKAFKALRLARAILRARRMKKKRVSQSIVSKYDDL